MTDFDFVLSRLKVVAYTDIVSVAASKKERDVYRFSCRNESPFLVRTHSPATVLLKELNAKININSVDL